MGVNSTTTLAARHVLRSDVRPQMAKASLPDIRIPDIEIWKEQIGRAIRRTRGELTLKEFASAIQRDERQIARWEKGEERPQLDAIFSVPGLRGPLVIALAELSDAVDVQTTITIRRTA